MEKINRELLIKDICPRLPYGVYVKFQHYDNPLFLYMKDALVVYNGGEMIDIIQYLYLRPMSSMTECEQKKLKEIVKIPNDWNRVVKMQDFFCSHHLDYRGLLVMGLALEAPEGMYKTE